MKISIIIPAYNEEKRIENTLSTYDAFFHRISIKDNYLYEIIVVLNGCIDNTLSLVTKVQKTAKTPIVVIDTPQAGKGLAIKMGFCNALGRSSDLIGFVDADMATSPESFYQLITELINDKNSDGIIASRYMPGSDIAAARPLYKRWGSKLIYEPLVKLLFNLEYYDLQCGAKIFKRSVVEKVTPHLTVQQWAFDVELLFLSKKYGFSIKEIPTQWQDQAHSKLTTKAGLKMLAALFAIWWRHQIAKV